MDAVSFPGNGSSRRFGWSQGLTAPCLKPAVGLGRMDKFEGLGSDNLRTLGFFLLLPHSPAEVCDSLLIAKGETPA